MLADKNPVIQKAYAELKKLSQDEEAQLLYEDREKAIRDENARMKTAHKRGYQQGFQQGKFEVAKNLLQMDVTLEQIAKAANLSIEEIEKLKKQ